jgi:hypothetical protein
LTIEGSPPRTQATLAHASAHAEKAHDCFNCCFPSRL